MASRRGKINDHRRWLENSITSPDYKNINHKHPMIRSTVGQQGVLGAVNG